MVDSNPFPFVAYLCDYLSLPSRDSLTIESLSGGLTNHTVRATFTHPIFVPGSSARHKSLILKHAPPYIASLGPEHALSTKRQAIEARSLAIFAEQDAKNPNLQELLLRHPNIRLPQLLYHDEQNCVLVMSDLGRVPTLLDYLSDGPDDFPNTARTLATFLADLHHSTRGISDSFLYAFTNEDSARVVQELVGSLPGKLLKSAGVPDAHTLGETAERDMADEKQEPCFGMVDLWPGSVLVGSDFVGLVDWEYAGKSTAGGEIGMLTAHLRIPLLSLRTSVNRSSVISDFLLKFLSSYAARSPVRSTAFIRSALLAHGRELINSVEFQGAELAGDQHKEALIQAGARCLRAAMCENRGDIEKMLSTDEILLLHELI